MTQALPLVRPEGLMPLSEHVFVIPDDSVRGVPNVGIVIGSDGALVIDTGMGLRNGEIVLEVARTLAGDKRLSLVTTHTHPEHDLGANAFPSDTVMIRARSQVEEIDEDGMRVADDFRRQSPAFAELLEGAAFRPADAVFDDDHTVDLGDVHVTLTAMGPNHTPGDTIAFVASDRVLFAGDLAMTPAPAFASAQSSLANWMASLDVLEALAPEIIVPSHGPTGDSRMISTYRDYFSRLRQRVVALHATGHTVDHAVDLLVDEFHAQYSDAPRVGGAVRAAYRELG